MTNKELKKLSRRELLEMLIGQSKELEKVQQELEEANRKLNDRRILLEETGSIAEAALKLNHVFEAAQEAANQYLENILSAKEEADSAAAEARAKAENEPQSDAVHEEPEAEATEE